MPSHIRLISSMATKQALAELVARYTRETDRSVRLESIGGVDAARRIRAGERFDIALLAAAAMQTLAKEGFITVKTIEAFAISRAALAIRPDVDRPSTIDENSIRDLIARARTIGISTGPSGVSVETLLKQWGIYEATKSRIVQAPPGIPVAGLIGCGDCEIGFQQLSELLGHPGIEIVGTVPERLIPTTVFSVGIGSNSANTDDAEMLVKFLLSRDAEAVKRQFGLEPP